MDRVKAGPVMPISIEMWLAPALPMDRMMVSGTDSLPLVEIQLLVARVFRGLAAHAGAGHDAGLLSKLLRPLDPGVPDCLARGHHRELRETVDEIQLLCFEMFFRGPVAGLRAVFELQAADVQLPDGANAALTLDQGFPELPRVFSEGGDDPDARDDDTPLHRAGREPYARAAPFAPPAVISLSSASTASFTLLIPSTPSSGMLTLNSVSSA